jgi:large subunit ribosomal protein L16
MLFPNRRKYKKEQKGNYPTGVSIKCNKINFGSFAIKATECGILTVNQIEATRRALVRKTKKLAKL